MDLNSWAEGFPGVIWELDPRRSRLRILAGRDLTGLEGETSRLLRDARWRRDVLLTQDVPLVEEFWDMATNGEPAAVSFSLGKGSHTYVLQGWPFGDGLYGGMLTEGAIRKAFIANGSVAECQLALGRAQYPVIVINTFQKEVVTCNEAAEELFRGISDGVFLDSIAPGPQFGRLMEVAGKALETGVWAGTLMLRSGEGSTIGARVRITPCTAGRDVVRMAMLKVQKHVAPLPGEEPLGIACKDPVPPLKEGLEALLASMPGVDGLMFSDIRSHHGSVEVYGVGRLFSALTWGAPHAYEGTIAQDIERYGLESLTVEDTMDSVKSIDWALFIPCGVRSYFARPFYGPQGLHAVLILASAEPGAFTETDPFQIYAPFERLVAGWRAAQNPRGAVFQHP